MICRFTLGHAKMGIARPDREATCAPARFARAAHRFLAKWLLAIFFVFVADAQAREGQPAVLILEQSAGLQAYNDIIASLRSTVLARTNTPPIFHTENLDLSRFQTPTYRQALDAYLQSKYRDVHIDVIVALG